MSKVEINILMGLPGSGKSTWRIKNEPTKNRYCCELTQR